MASEVKLSEKAQKIKEEQALKEEARKRRAVYITIPVLVVLAVLAFFIRPILKSAFYGDGDKQLIKENVIKGFAGGQGTQLDKFKAADKESVYKARQLVADARTNIDQADAAKDEAVKTALLQKATSSLDEAERTFDKMGLTYNDPDWVGLEKKEINKLKDLAAPPEEMNYFD